MGIDAYGLDYWSEFDADLGGGDTSGTNGQGTSIEALASYEYDNSALDTCQYMMVNGDYDATSAL